MYLKCTINKIIYIQIGNLCYCMQFHIRHDGSAKLYLFTDYMFFSYLSPSKIKFVTHCTFVKKWVFDRQDTTLHKVEGIVRVSAIVVYFTLKQPLYLPFHLPRIILQQVYVCDQVKYLQCGEMMGCPTEMPGEITDCLTYFHSAIACLLSWLFSAVLSKCIN